jgi:hypothetical protein
MASPVIDPWICRIPRELLHGLAASQSVGRRSRVLVALLAKLYENYTRDQGVTDASLTYLATTTGLDVRTVRTVLADLRQAGVLEDVSAPAGRHKTMRLSIPRMESPQGARIPSIQGPRQKRAGSPSKARTVPRVDSAHPINEREELSEELFQEPPSVLTHIGSPLGDTAAEVALSTNGHLHVHATTAVLDGGRNARIHQMLIAVLSSSGLLTPAVRQRWRVHIDQLTPEVAARSEISESLVGRRARDFFIRETWARTGNAQEGAHLRARMLRSVAKREKAANR